MMLPLEIKDSDNNLIIAPHPDDESIGMGGFLALYAKQSTVIVVSDGGEGAQGEAHGHIARQRKQEFETAMTAIGAKAVHWLGFPDGGLMMYPECMENVDFSPYDKIFIPWGNDDHPDHAAVCQYALTAMDNQRIAAEVFQYEVHCPFHTPDTFLDISDVLETKSQMIRSHKSQVIGRCYPEIAVALAMYRASQANNPTKAYECYLKTDIHDQFNQEFLNREKEIAKYKMFYQIAANIARLQKQGFSIADFLLKKHCRRVSIYGFGLLGKLLLELLKNTEISLVDIIDKRIIHNSAMKVSTVPLAESNKDVDAVVVTAVTDFENIEKELSSNGYQRIYSLAALIDNMMETMP